MVHKLEQGNIGAIAPNITLRTPEGSTISLYDVQGKVKLIDFWASWCSPCRQENVNVLKLYKMYSPKGFEVLSISLDEQQENWVKAIGADGMTWNHGSEYLCKQTPILGRYMVHALAYPLSCYTAPLIFANALLVLR